MCTLYLVHLIKAFNTDGASCSLLCGNSSTTPTDPQSPRAMKNEGNWQLRDVQEPKGISIAPRHGGRIGSDTVSPLASLVSFSRIPSYSFDQPPIGVHYNFHAVRKGGIVQLLRLGVSSPRGEEHRGAILHFSWFGKICLNT